MALGWACSGMHPPLHMKMSLPYINIVSFWNRSPCFLCMGRTLLCKQTPVVSLLAANNKPFSTPYILVVLTGFSLTERQNHCIWSHPENTAHFSVYLIWIHGNSILPSFWLRSLYHPLFHMLPYTSYLVPQQIQDLSLEPISIISSLPMTLTSTSLFCHLPPRLAPWSSNLTPCWHLYHPSVYSAW